MGGEVTVYSGAGVGAADGGMDDISSNARPPCMLGKPGMLGICMPRIGGIPPIDMSCPIIVEELDIEEELEKLDDEDILFEKELDPIFMSPIILLIMSSIPRLGICIPPIEGIPPMPPIIPPIPIIPSGMGPPEDIMVEDEEEDEDDLKDEIVDPSSD